MANRPRRKIVFFRRRKGLPGAEGFPDRPPRKKIRIGEMKKGIFILPSLLTLTSIFFSFYAIICAIDGQFMLSGALILVAAFFDGIDGKVARLTKTTTRFGLELDSLADVISFGVAPADTDVPLGVKSLRPHRVGRRLRICCLRRSQAGEIQHPIGNYRS